MNYSYQGKDEKWRNGAGRSTCLGGVQADRPGLQRGWRVPSVASWEEELIGASPLPPSLLVRGQDPDGSHNDASNSAGCTAFRPVKCSICCRHENPGATMISSGAAARIAGNNRCSPICREIS